MRKKSAQNNSKSDAGSTPFSDDDISASEHSPPPSKIQEPPKPPTPPTVNDSIDSSSKRKKKRSKSNSKESSISVCDLTQLETPITSSDDDESEIEIIDQVINTRTEYAPSIAENYDNNVNNESPEISINDRHNFEKYTMNGIGGKLLRKAGWNGDKETLYEKDGPIQQANKYLPLQKGIFKHRGLGYAHSHSHNHHNSNTNSHSHSRPTSKQRAKPKPIQPPSRRVFGSTASQRRVPSKPANRSNTADTAIVLGDSDDDDDDNDTEKKQNHRVEPPQNKDNQILNLFGSLNGSRSHSHSQKKNKKRKSKKRKHHEISSSNLVDDDDDVVIVSKGEITQKRINKIPFNQIISRLRVDTEENTKKYIEKCFAGKTKKKRKNKLAVTKMVVSVKDSYSQCKIAVPVRGEHCTHLQPFDAKSFLMRPKKYQKCTTCDQNIKKEELIKSLYFQKIFDDMRLNYDEDIEQIEIMRDGTWKPVIPKEQRRKRQKVMKQREIVGIDDSDSEQPNDSHDSHTEKEDMNEDDNNKDVNRNKNKDKDRSQSVIILSDDSDSGSRERSVSQQLQDMLNGRDKVRDISHHTQETTNKSKSKSKSRQNRTFHDGEQVSNGRDTSNNNKEIDVVDLLDSDDDDIEEIHDGSEDDDDSEEIEEETVDESEIETEIEEVEIEEISDDEDL